MARKRMIDPQIWLSEDFSNLSILARLVWVGLISNADDDGRGKANSSYLKSQLFPFDEELSVKKIENCLKEIEKLMKIKFYEVEGKKYYQLLNWKKFQTINKPTPSQIPEMPIIPKKNEDKGLKNSLTSHVNVKEDYGSTTVVVSEDYRLEDEDEIEDEIKDDDDIKEKNKKSSSSIINTEFNFKILEDEKLNCDITSVKFKSAVNSSQWLGSLSLLDASWLNKNYNKIVEGYYQNYSKSLARKNGDANFKQRDYSGQNLNALFCNLDDLDLGEVKPNGD